LAASSEASGILDGLPLHIKRRHAGLSTEIVESIKEQVVKAQNAIARSNSALEPLLVELIDDVS
jgi:phage terminase Nu1 subunit (DNA packaging protein)